MTSGNPVNSRTWIALKTVTERFVRVLALLSLSLSAVPMGAGPARSAEATLWDRTNPLALNGWFVYSPNWTAATGNTRALRDGVHRWKTDFDHSLQGSLLVDGHLSPELTLNGTLLFDSRYADDPWRAWDRAYWDHFRLNLALDTAQPFWGDWNLKGRLNLDRDPNWRNRYPDSRLLMEPLDELRLEAGLELKGPWALLRAGDVQARLGPTDLTLYERSAFGLQAELSGDQSRLQLIGAEAKGEVFYQTPVDSLGLRADGTSGPYRLAHSPLVRGSESVWIETRDRFDPSIVLERTPQRRLIDYTIDYARGVLTFMRPIESETFADDPVYIAVQYGYDARDTGYDRYLSGVRGVAGFSALDFGVTWAGEFDRAGSWRGPEPRPRPLNHQVYGFDTAIRPVQGTRLEFSASASDTGSSGGNADHRAFAARFESTTLDRLKLTGTYRRLENRFDPIANRFLVGQRDREELEARAELQASAEVRTWLGERTTRSLRSGADGVRATDAAHVAGAAWRISGGPELTGEMELRDQYDGRSRGVRDDRRLTGRLGARQTFGRLDLGLRGELERFDQRAAADGAHDQLLRIKLAPTYDFGRGLSAGGELKSELARDRRTVGWRSGRDFGRVRLEYRPGRTLSGLASYEARRERTLHDGFDLVGGRTRTTDVGWSLGGDWGPAEAWRTLARLERQTTHDHPSGVDLRRSLTWRHEFFYRPSRDLELHLDYRHGDLSDLQKIGVPGAGDHRLDNEITGEATWNRGEATALSTGLRFHDRRLYRPERADTQVRRIFAGVTHRIGRDLELIGEVDYAWLDGEPLESTSGSPKVENQRLRGSGELAWSPNPRTRLALGHERVDFDETPDPETSEDYSAGRTYLKLIGRF